MTDHSDFESKTPLDQSDFAQKLGVTAPVMGKLNTYLGLLVKWQKRFNLVGQKTMDDPWRRHFLDSAQLWPFLRDKDEGIADLGTGAGFPGLVLSVMGCHGVQLIDSDANKVEFLRQVIRQTGVDAALHRSRLEDYSGPKVATVISRACASLNELLGYASNIAQPDAKALFLKGKTWRDELTLAQTLWHIDHTCHPSLTDPNGIILEIHEFNRR